MAKHAASEPLDKKVGRIADLLKALGTILGVLGFFLALFPGLRLALTGLFAAKYEVNLGTMYGARLEKLTDDQFYSWVWAKNGLRSADNIFKVEGSLLPNVGGQPVPAYKPDTRQALAFVQPGQCVYVRSLRFSLFKDDPQTSLLSLQESELEKPGSSPAAQLLTHLPANFTPDGCAIDAKEAARKCGGVAVWATVSLSDCGTSK